MYCHSIGRAEAATVRVVLFIDKERIVDHQYVPVTERLFKEHLAGDKTCVFATTEDIPKKIKEIIRGITKKDKKVPAKGARIVVTEPLSPLAVEGVKRITKKLGFRATCKPMNKRLRYLYSDFGGHYSTDYYEFLEYSQICVTVLQSAKNDKENS